MRIQDLPPARLRDTKATYFLCPDHRCRLFFKPNCHVPCDHHCPRKAKKAVVCWKCHKVILLPYDHWAFCRVDCECGAMNMQAMSSNYRRHNLKSDTGAKRASMRELDANERGFGPKAPAQAHARGFDSRRPHHFGPCVDQRVLVGCPQRKKTKGDSGHE